MLLFFISFIAGILTALAPCVLPLLPVIVGGSMSVTDQGSGATRRAFVIAVSLGLSVIVFTLLLKASTILIDVPQSAWELFSGVILVLFGIVMVFPTLWDRLGFVGAMNRSSNKLLASGYQRNSFFGDFVMGAALGPVFSSCSPTYFIILATVLPASFFMGLTDLVAYAIGLSGFLLVIAIAGQKLVDKLGITIEPGGWFRRTIGVLFIIIGLAVGTGAEASTEAWLLNHGFDLTFIEADLLGAQNSAPISVNATSTALLSPQEKAMLYPKAPELTGIAGYINTPIPPKGQSPITIGQFEGKKVVLIDFWTYSCINCQREIPYVEMWQQKYASQGLEIIGVSTPEFAFEHVLSNVQNAVNQFGITYPVVLDNDDDTWRAFDNEFWPNLYLIDIDGYIVYSHSGEGDYAQTELAIQRALTERDERLGLPVPNFAPPTTPNGAVEVNESELGSPETYFGANRNEFLANGEQGQTGSQTLSMPSNIQPNSLYLGGTWQFDPEYATNQAAGASIRYEYQAKNVYFVAAGTNGPVTIKIMQDGAPLPDDMRGKDVNANSEVTIQADRLYDIVTNPDYGVHTLDIEVESSGLQAYTFTFG